MRCFLTTFVRTKKKPDLEEVKSLKRHKAKGKMTARERIDALLDDLKPLLKSEPSQEKICTRVRRMSFRRCGG